MLVVVTDYVGLLLLAVVLGVTKGVRAVFYNLVVPDNVDFEQLASAIGLQAVFTGVFLLINGPVIGLLLTITSRCIYLRSACRISQSRRNLPCV